MQYSIVEIIEEGGRTDVFAHTFTGYDQDWCLREARNKMEEIVASLLRRLGIESTDDHIKFSFANMGTFRPIIPPAFDYLGVSEVFDLLGNDMLSGQIEWKYRDSTYSHTLIVCETSGQFSETVQVSQ